MNVVDTIFNRFGIPEIRLLENGRFVSFSGFSIGFLNYSSVYDYNGRHLGWFENGVLRDHWGSVIGFGETPTDYPLPLLPLKSLKPLQSLIQLEPLRPLTQLPPLKPLKSFNWSSFSPITLFYR